MSNSMFHSPSEPRILYMGTPAISAIVLTGLLENHFNVIGLVCNEDKPVGRKGKIEPPPTKVVAQKFGIPVFQPHRIRLENDFIRELKPDVIVTMAYGQIVPEVVLSAPKYGCLNLHGSLLPSWRGAAPIQRSLMAGEKETGVTLMEMVAAMDAGRMYDKAVVVVDENDNYSSLSEKIGLAARDLILRDLLPYLNGNLKGEQQNEKLVTFATKIKPEEEHLNLSMASLDFIHMIQGLSEKPGGYLLLDGKKMKILKASIFSAETSQPVGSTLPHKKKLLLQLSDGVISLDEVQLEGKKMMDGTSFLNGFRSILEGARFE